MFMYNKIASRDNYIIFYMLFVPNQSLGLSLKKYCCFHLNKNVNGFGTFILFENYKAKMDFGNYLSIYLKNSWGK